MSVLPAHTHGIILFDGVCNYCSRWVDFVMKHDKRDYFRFATLQSLTGQNLLQEKNSSLQHLDSVVFIEGEEIYFKSDAALHIMRKLSFPFNVSCIFLAVPKFIRNGIYGFIARNRYKWFGKKESCRIPVNEKEKAKFL